MSSVNVLKELTARIERIEQHLGLSTPEVAASPTHTVESSGVSEAMLAPRSSALKGSSRISSANLLALIAVICMILAAAFVIRLAVDSGWFTPLRQVGATAVLGAVLVGVGLFLKERDVTYASSVPATGVVVLYLSIVGAQLYHGLIGPHSAVVLCGVVSFLSLWLFTVFKSELYPVVAATGSYLSPLLLGVPAGELEVVAIYFVAWSTVYAVLSVFLRTRTLSIISAYLGIGLLAFLAITLMEGREVSATIAGVQLLQFLILLFGILAFSIVNRTALTNLESWALYPALVFFYASQYQFLDDVAQEVAPYLMLSLAGILAGAYWVGKKVLTDTKASYTLVEGYSVITLFHSLYLEILDEVARPLVLVGLLLYWVYFSQQSHSRISSVSAMLVLIAVVFIEYFGVLSHVALWQSSSIEVIWLLYGVVVAGLLLLKGYRSSSGKENGLGMLSFILGHSMVVGCLYGVCEPLGSFALSLSWSVYAAIVMGIGFRVRHEALAKSSLAVLFFAVAKVFTYDVSNAAPLVRILCLVLTAAVLYGCGWILRRIEGWSSFREGAP